MAVDIYILNQRCDIPIGVEIAANFATNNLGQIDNRQGIYTTTILLPDTNHNRIIFENANELISSSLLPYGVMEARIEVDGVIQVIGFARLISSKSGFNIHIVGGNADWFNKVGDDNLNQMDLSLELNHKWEESQVVGRRSNTWELGGTYPNADYGLFTTQVSTTVQFYNLYFGVYCKWLMQKIFDDIDLTLTGYWWDNDTLLQKEFIPFSGSWIRDRNYQYRNSFSVVYNTNMFINDINSLSFPLHTGQATTTPVSDYDFIPSKDFTYDTAITVPKNNHWLILDSGTITVNYSITFKNSATPGLISKSSFIYIDQNGNQQAILIADMSALAPSSIHTFTGTINIYAQRGAIYFNGGDIQIQSGSNFSFSIIPDEDEDYYLSIDDTFSYITVGSTLPELKKIDLLRTIWNQFGIIFTTDVNTGLVNIFTLAEVFANINNADDWSDKIDTSEEPEISYNMDGYAQKNYFRYQTDGVDEFLTIDTNYGRGEINIENTTLDTQQDVFISEFAPIKRINSFNGARQMGFIPKFLSGEEQGVVPRICYIEFNPDNNITIGTNPVEPTQPNIYFDDLRFSKLIPIYYVTLLSILNNTKIVNCLLRLNNVDIANLDFTKPKYIDYFGAYFWLNEIRQFKFTSDGESTPVELVRI